MFLMSLAEQYPRFINAIINQSKESLTIIKCPNNWGEAVEDALYKIDELRTRK